MSPTPPTTKSSSSWTKTISSPHMLNSIRCTDFNTRSTNTPTTAPKTTSLVPTSLHQESLLSDQRSSALLPVGLPDHPRRLRRSFAIFKAQLYDTITSERKLILRVCMPGRMMGVRRVVGKSRRGRQGSDSDAGAAVRGRRGEGGASSRT